MKKLALILAIALIAAFTAPAMAADVTIGGTYWVYGIHEDQGFNDQIFNPVTGTFESAADEDSYFRQNFRVPVTWAVNDNVSGNLRLDFSEATFGLGTTDSVWSRGNVGTTTLQVDRAYVQIDTDMFRFRAGQQFGGIGNYIMVDHNFFGFDLQLKFNPITIGLQYAKLNENGDVMDNAGMDDDDFYMVSIGYAADTFSLGAAYAYTNNDTVAFDDERKGVALFGNANIGAVALKAEVDFFFGDAAPNVDYEGTNIFIDASMALNDMLTAGLSFVYGQGNDDAGDTQLNTIHSAGAAFSLFDYGGALNQGFVWGYFGGAQGVFELDPEAGSVGFMARLDASFTETLTGYFRIGYAEPDEDDVTPLDNAFILIGSIDYAWMPNVVLSGGAGYVKPDMDVSGVNDDAQLELIALMTVSF